MKKIHGLRAFSIGCPFCSGRGIKFGRTGAGKVRYQCTLCRKTFGRKKHSHKTAKRLEIKRLMLEQKAKKAFAHHK